MTTIERQVDLSGRNTLGVSSTADYYSKLSSTDQLSDLVNTASENKLAIRVLGGGSNLILSEKISGLVISNELMGIKVVSEHAENVDVRVFAGESWHSFVAWTVENGFSGIENLASIPGTAGAAPVQNIGAYGVEVDKVILSVDAFDQKKKSHVTFSNEACDFAYRDSLFKKHEGRFIITSVLFQLSKVFRPVLNYGPLKSLSSNENLKPIDVFDEVVRIRAAKLPDPNEIPNVGSFFKNPIIDSRHVEQLKKKYPGLICFPQTEGYKVAAGWLVDQAGFRGQFSKDNVGCYKEQALVVINPNHASANKVLNWADEITSKVKLKFNIELEIEPRIWK